MTNTDEKSQELSPLQQAAVVLKKKQAELDAIKFAQTEPIAIIGMACRFPDADNPDAYWRLLHNGVDAITEVPPGRWDVDAFFDLAPEVPGKSYTRHGGFLPDIDRFEPAFFGISPREAVEMDPHQRLLLEVAWEALEDAGQAPTELVGRAVGVFFGMSGLTGYAAAKFSGDLSGDPEDITAYTATGSTLSVSAGRLSYVLGLQGPALALDTACSSSLVAFHQACQSLRNGECEMALAGGVSLIIFPAEMVILSRLQALSPDGRCKTFDAGADGFSQGEGCGIVVLKRLPDALADGDNILAVIRGSAINHDGVSSGLTVPSRLAQEKVIRQALKNARVEPAEVEYIEAHGTGTSLGDPIEVGALGTVFAKNHSPDSPLVIGSVKTNFGHLDSAAGIAGLMKVVLSLRHQEIPSHLHFKEPNPLIGLENLPFLVPVERQPWPRGKTRRIAGVSSFGIGGTNAHVVLEEAPAVESEPPLATVERPLHLLVLSAKGREALREQAASYADWLKAHPEASLADVCFTAATGRSHFEHRLTLVVALPGEAEKKLRNADYIVGKADREKPEIAFLFTGQGAQYVGMGRQLFETQPLFRTTLERCDAILRPLDVPLLDLLYGDAGSADLRSGIADAKTNLLDQTIYTQPALFSLEYALAQLWQSWGVTPDALMGHSVGEYVAACVAGVFDLEDGLKLIAARGRLMQTLCEPGAMLALPVSEAEALDLIAPFSKEISLAAINGPENVVVSGTHESMEKFSASLTERDIKGKPLSVSHAFHSAMMEPMLAEFQEIAESITYAKPGIPLCSNATGKVADEEIMDPAYWVRHVREPVRFATGMAALHEEGIGTFLEIGPKPVLLGMAGQCLPDDTEGIFLPTLREGQNDWRQMLESLGQWHVRSGAVDWKSFEKDYVRRKVQLPTYPFQRQRYWIDKARLARRATQDPLAHPLLGKRLRLSRSEDIYFESEIDLSSIPWLTDYRVFDVAVFPAAGYLEMALSVGADIVGAQGAVPLRMVNVTLEQVLILPEEEAITVQIVLSPEENAQSPAGIESPADNKNHVFQVSSLDGTANWIPHVTGQLVAVGEDSGQPGPVDLEKLQSQCPTEVPVGDHYQSCRERGLNYGPGFQGIQRLFRGEGMVLGEIELPESLTAGVDARENDKYRLHPALLDACLQVCIPVILDASDGTWLPTGIKELRFHRFAGAPLWSFAKVVDSDERNATFDLSLLDESGIPIAELEGLVVERIGEETLQQHFKKQENGFYEIGWTPGPIITAKDSLAEETAGSWLIFADGKGLGEELAGRLAEAGQRCILVYADVDWGLRGEPQHEDNVYHLDPAEPADFERLLKNAFQKEISPLKGIIHLWSLDAPDTDELTAEALSQAQILSCGSVLHLVQAAIGHKQSARLWLVTRNAVSVGQESDSLAVAQAPLWGLGKVIAQEHPDLWGGMIDDPTAGELLTEIGIGSDEGNEDQVAYRDGQRYVARLVRSGPPPADAQASLHPENSYLITGGLGGLGLQVARWMVDKGARHLVLTGRSSPSEAALAVISQLKETGAEIRVINADVSVEAQVLRLFQEMDADMPPLAGIIHAAGVSDLENLSRQDWDRFSRGMAAKVEGSWHLHVLSRSMALDFFVCFSSLSSFLGGLRMGNYVAANTFMDALADFRVRRGLPGLSINWGHWAGGGMSAMADSRMSSENFKEFVLSCERGLQILDLLMGAPGVVRAGVLQGRLWKYLREFYPSRIPPFLSELAQGPSGPSSKSGDFIESLKNMPPEEQRNYLFAHIQSELGQVLGFDPSQPMDPQTGFTDLGMDSLMVVESRNRLQTSLGHSLSLAVLFNYSTLDALVDHIAGKLLGLESSKEAIADTDRPSDRIEEGILSRVEQLSEQDAEKLLAEKFG
uniref:Acyl transferase domain-containing protein n=1 Tax=Candidatus Kentrum sp. FW TaxID=2126338 RepID=A0A450TTR6_9GAMM|nr:MAG: Acyl transferase domain-containing protein [Candidatus Kentron sp. FW]